ncbi:MBL fold metallo-hydrolase [Tessaracoccus coleopterorum]|uniref:MBL fold metallo-hydrolase n=1 Tax=Tessaracoccus coleopterorum TaxID=2714950 RepID=UPI002F90F170
MITHAVTSGSFSLDGQTFDVDNNVWLVGDEREVIVIDAPHDVDAILAAVGGRRVQAIVCTHAHDDHVRYAPNWPTGPGRRSGCTRTMRRCGS